MTNEMVLTNVEKEVIRLRREHLNTWRGEEEDRWRKGIAEAYLDLYLALEGSPHHVVEKELAQIASICINWIEKRMLAHSHKEDDETNPQRLRQIAVRLLQSYANLTPQHEMESQAQVSTTAMHELSNAIEALFVALEIPYQTLEDHTHIHGGQT